MRLLAWAARLLARLGACVASDPSLPPPKEDLLDG